jgi:hypothetical protein
LAEKQVFEEEVLWHLAESDGERVGIAGVCC